jgi:hypothetical protein
VSWKRSYSKVETKLAALARNSFEEETGAEFIIGILNVPYVRTVERESELNNALDDMKFDITELSEVRIFGEAMIKEMAIYLLIPVEQKFKWKRDFWQRNTNTVCRGRSRVSKWVAVQTLRMKQARITVVQESNSEEELEDFCDIL